jgi:hypothetical protein
MQDVMIDLETLGTAAGCTILSIGAVAFDADEDELSEAPYAACILRSSCAAAGLFEDDATISWWMQQDRSVSQILDLAREDDFAIPLQEVLADFAMWMSQFDPDVRMWGNGADFDLPILAAAYRAVRLPVPWKPYSGRCYRTLKNLRRDVALVRIGSLHNAVDDAYSQAAHAIRILRAMQPRPWWRRVFG